MPPDTLVEDGEGRASFALDHTSLKCQQVWYRAALCGEALTSLIVFALVWRMTALSSVVSQALNPSLCLHASGEAQYSDLPTAMCDSVCAEKKTSSTDTCT